MAQNDNLHPHHINKLPVQVKELRIQKGENQIKYIHKAGNLLPGYEIYKIRRVWK
mgnify:CR=1 FL=1